MKTKTITIVGRRWRQKTYGNTYHTAEILIDGKIAHKTERAYGSGSAYVVTALEWLARQGYVPPSAVLDSARLAEAGVTLEYFAVDVLRKKDL